MNIQKLDEGGVRTGVVDVIIEELHLEITNLIKHKKVSPDMYPNVPKSLDAWKAVGHEHVYPSSVYLATVELGRSVVNCLYIMIPTLSNTFLHSWTSPAGLTKDLRYSFELEKEFPLLLYAGSVIKGKLPYSVGATELKKGILKKERTFLPLTGMKLDPKTPEESYRSQVKSTELIDQLNRDEEMKSLLRKLQTVSRYSAMQEMTDTYGGLDLVVSFEQEKEALVNLVQIGDHVAITVVSTPDPVDIPAAQELYGEFYNRWRDESFRHVEDEIIGRRTVLGDFVPYGFSLPEKVRLMERIATVVQDYRHQGPIESSYVPSGGVSDFLSFLKRPFEGEEVRVDFSSYRHLSVKEKAAWTAESAIALVRHAHEELDYVSIGYKKVEPRSKILQILSEGDWQDRSEMVRILGRDGSEKSVEPLIRTLKDENWQVRNAAVNALSKIKDARAVEPLVQVLKDAQPEVRNAAAYALSKFKDARAVEPLTWALKDGQPQTRISAAHALGCIGDPRALEALVESLWDENTTVRKVSAYALGEIGDARALAPLAQASNDKSWSVRSTAKGAIKKIQKKR